MIKIIAENVDVFYGSKQALFDVLYRYCRKQVTALIGPSGCGKVYFFKMLEQNE